MKTNLRNWFLFSLLAVFSFSLASCGSDDEVTNTPSIIGKWQIEKINVNGMEIPQMGTAATLEFKTDAKCMPRTLIFQDLTFSSNLLNTSITIKTARFHWLLSMVRF